jgi:hypothetical protein
MPPGIGQDTNELPDLPQPERLLSSDLFASGDALKLVRYAL